MLIIKSSLKSCLNSRSGTHGPFDPLIKNILNFSVRSSCSWIPAKVDNIVPIVQEPLKPEDVIKPIDVLQIEPEDLKNLTSAPIVKEAIDDLYSTTTVLSTTTPFLAETTPAEVEPSLKPVVIILPANVTIDEIKTAIDLLPDTNNTAGDTNNWNNVDLEFLNLKVKLEKSRSWKVLMEVGQLTSRSNYLQAIFRRDCSFSWFVSLNIVTVIAGQTPLIENENILDHPEELITQDDIEHIEPISNPVDLVKAIESTLPQGGVCKNTLIWLASSLSNQNSSFLWKLI